MSSKPRTVWIVNQYGGSPYHGRSYRWYYLAKEFAAQGNEVHLFSASFTHLLDSPPKVNGRFTHELIDGINYHWVKVPPYHKSKGIPRALSMIRFLIQLRHALDSKNGITQPDVVIVSSPSPFPIWNALKWRKKTGAKVVFDVRDLWPQTLIDLGDLSPKHPFVLFMKRFERLAYHKSDLVVSVLAHSKEYMQNEGLDPEKFVYIPNGIDFSEFEQLEPAPEETLNRIPADSFIVGYAGTIGIHNAMESFIDAARILMDSSETKVHFVVIGDGVDRTELEARSAGLTNITFLDAVPKRQVQSVIKKFDLCYIGWRKTKLFANGVSPNKLFEYMFAAKPILYSIETPLPLMEESGCGFAVPAEDSAAIAESIIKISKLPQESREKIGEQGKLFAREHHDYRALARQYLETV